MGMNVSSNGNGNGNWYMGMGENGNEKPVPAHLYTKRSEAGNMFHVRGPTTAKDLSLTPACCNLHYGPVTGETNCIIAHSTEFLMANLQPACPFSLLIILKPELCSKLKQASSWYMHSFYLIQGHRFWCQSKAHMQLPISD